MANDGASLGSATPIFRVFDLPQALDWYQRVLGFQIAWIGVSPLITRACVAILRRSTWLLNPGAT